MEAWDRRPPVEQRRLAEAELARWLPTALVAAPFHAARSSEGAVPWRQLPPVRERDLLADAPAGSSAVVQPTSDQVAATAPRHVLTAIARAIGRGGADARHDAMVRAYRPLQLHRGGVAGELLVASTRSDLDRMHRAGARAAAVLGLGDGDVVASLVRPGPTLTHLAVVHLAMGAGLTAFHTRDAGDDLAASLAAARVVAPSVLVVERAEVRRCLEVEGVETLDRLRQVVLVGPPPSEDERGELAEAFGARGRTVRVRSMWAPSAGRSPWAECAEGGGGLHTTPDLEHLEVLDPTTGRATDGEGDLTLTSVGWHGTAHVRFQTGARVGPLVTDPCPGCGRTVPRLVGTVEPHAWEPEVRDAGTTTPIDLRGVGVVLATTPNVGRWRAELRRGDGPAADDLLLVEVAGPRSVDRAGALGERLAQATGMIAPEVRVVDDDGQVDRGIAAAGGVLADRR